MVRVYVWTPQALTEDEREILETLRNSESFVPKPEKESGGKSFFSRVKDVFTG